MSPERNPGRRKALGYFVIAFLGLGAAAVDYFLEKYKIITSPKQNIPAWEGPRNQEEAVVDLSTLQSELELQPKSYLSANYTGGIEGLNKEIANLMQGNPKWIFVEGVITGKNNYSSNWGILCYGQAKYPNLLPEIGRVTVAPFLGEPDQFKLNLASYIMSKNSPDKQEADQKLDLLIYWPNENDSNYSSDQIITPDLLKKLNSK